MRLKGKKYKNKGITFLCLVLVVCNIFGLWFLGNGLNGKNPNNPIDNNRAQVLDMLMLGEGKSRDEFADETDENSETGRTQGNETKEESNSENNSDATGTNQEKTESDDIGTGDGDNGQEDGLKGEEGEEEAKLDLGVVMTWYKYGTQPTTIVCDSFGEVLGSVNTAQILNNELKYSFSLTGELADEVKITKVSVKEGDGSFMEIDDEGEMSIYLSNAVEGRDYTFRVETIREMKDDNGNITTQDIDFRFVVHFAYALDLELELTWQKEDEGIGKVVCAANEKAAKTIESNELIENVFAYTPKLVGTYAEDAKLTKGEYKTSSGESGKLNTEGGTLILQTHGSSDKETYYLTFEGEVKKDDGSVQSVIYNVTIVFVETVDIDLSFTWLERGNTPRTMICQPGEKVSTDVKNNQLSAGAIKYEINLLGKDSENARILSVTYISEGVGGGTLSSSGALPVTLPSGSTSNTYKILVVVLMGGKQINYEIDLCYSMDVSLEMTYAVKENGLTSIRSVLCENGKTKTADPVYDDQLTDGNLSYRLAITGTESLNITSVSCYQSGSGSTVSVEKEDEITLLLKNGKTGENTFTVTAADNIGTEYKFRINVPYKHRGENTIKISTNMVNNQVVTNDTSTNFNVKAWSEDETGRVVGYIPANGTDTKLIVKLDGEILNYVSTSGQSSEFILYPKNPVTGDTNEHTLYVYAEDGYGNFGELTLTLRGQRNQAGQKKGVATIYVDMTVLGLGVVDSLSYEVLANEPISYTVAKAILGEDTGEPFGAAEGALGWGGSYTGTLDVGFYLQSLTPGLTANGLEKSSWNKYGSNEAEILQAIDDRFGAGTGLATLWRCIYRNGINKSSGTDGSYGEFDFTSGSGWMFALDGTYYPGLSMSQYSLEDGDVLTLRYTLAHGWDVGGGTKGYGNTTGYCVTALNGNYYINHQMEMVENPDGTQSYMCHCCGLVEGCAHQNVNSKNLGDGTHVSFCEDCKTTIGDSELHVWECKEESHICGACKAEEAHDWKEQKGSNTATCTEEGTRTVYCTVCAMTRKETSPAKGHTLDNRWNHTKTEHYQKCSTCKEVIAESMGIHKYQYNASDDDWYCVVCDAGHDWDYCGNGGLMVESSTCNKIIHHCDDCGLNLEKTGDFPENHIFVEGSCTHCGGTDPNYSPEPKEPEAEELETQVQEPKEPEIEVP